MNEMIINGIANDLGITTKQVNVVLEMLGEGNTIPFIARYRKEVTEALDEEEIRKISEVGKDIIIFASGSKPFLIASVALVFFFSLYGA